MVCIRMSSLPSRISSSAKFSLSVWSRIFISLVFFDPNRAQPVPAQQTFEGDTKRANGVIDAGLRSQRDREGCARRGGLRGVGGGQEDRGADRRRRERRRRGRLPLG